jgi:single-strand DNA-binding protein
VSGRLKQRSYETKEGEKRTVYEVEVDDVGPSLRNASAKVTKAQRSSPGGNGSGGFTASGGATQPRTQAASAGGDPWASDEPPF